MIERSREGPVTVLRLAHGKANAFDTELCRELVRVLEEERREGGRAVLLTGRGSIFCAGVDLFRVLHGGDEYLDGFLQALDSFIRALHGFPGPVVAAVNGHAIAGGAIAVWCCDYSLMAEGSARIGVPELRVGVPFPAIALEVARARTPAAAFADVVLRGRLYDPSEARELGLVDQVVDPAELSEASLAVAVDLASVAPEAFALTKQQARSSVLAAAALGGPEVDRRVWATWKASATRERIREYLDRVVGRSS